MKTNILFLFLALPLFAAGQNYLFEITPDNGQFRVLVTDDTREAYPRDITDFGLLDTASLKLFAYQRIEQAKSRQASLMAQTFLAELNVEQTQSNVGAFVTLDYDAEWAAQYLTTYEANYKYQVRGTPTNLPIYIADGEVRRQSNNALLGTVAPVTANHMVVTRADTQEAVDLYQLGNIWVGRNALGQVVTLKRQ